MADSVENTNDLLNQKLYDQKILPLSSLIKDLDGVQITNDIPYLLSIESNIDKLNNNLIKTEL